MNIVSDLASGVSRVTSFDSRRIVIEPLRKRGFRFGKSRRNESARRGYLELIFEEFQEWFVEQDLCCVSNNLFQTKNELG